MDKRLLEILVCPACKGNLRLSRENTVAPVSGELICDRDRLAFPIRDDIPVMLVDAARSLDDDDPTAG